MKTQLISQLNAAYEYFERSTRSLTEEDSGFAPADGVFTAANQVAHVAQTIDWFIDGAFTRMGSTWISSAMSVRFEPSALLTKRAHG